jgi:hypothetical protein
MKIPKRLSKEQQAAKDALVALLANRDEADRRYDNLPETHGGRVISTDLARFLDTRYRDVPTGQPRDLVPSWDLAWRYAHDRLKRELDYQGKRRTVRFMAGGWGAGKTHALEHAPMTDLAWDGTLSNPKQARLMIERALKNGWRVEIAYVFRDIELAIYGAVERAISEGRSVPLDQLPNSHRAVQISIRSLIRRYRRNPHVAFMLLHNTGAKWVRGNPLVFSEAELAPKGALHYSVRHEHYYAEAAREIQALNPPEG